MDDQVSDTGSDELLVFNFY